MRKSGTIHRCS